MEKREKIVVEVCKISAKLYANRGLNLQPFQLVNYLCFFQHLSTFYFRVVWCVNKPLMGQSTTSKPAVVMWVCNPSASRTEGGVGDRGHKRERL